MRNSLARAPKYEPIDHAAGPVEFPHSEAAGEDGPSEQDWRAFESWVARLRSSSPPFSESQDWEAMVTFAAALVGGLVLCYVLTKF